jgi:hypothetical protein
MKKVYTKGNLLAKKQLLMASATYNLKKLMKFTGPKSVLEAKMAIISAIKRLYLPVLDGFFYYLPKIKSIHNYL